MSTQNSPTVIGTTAEQMIDRMYMNSVLFMKKAVEQLTENSSLIIDRDGAVLASVYIQLSLELAIKSCITRKEGIKAILEGKHVNESDEALLLKIENSDVRTREFESLKNYVKGNADKYKLTKDGIRIIDKFQRYRNKLVHIDYKFTDDELNTFKVDLTYIIAHVIILLLSEERGESPSEFYRWSLSGSQFDKLISFPLYVNAMHDLVLDRFSTALYCPYCSQYTLTPDKDMCYCCLWGFDNPHVFGYVDCDYCGETECVIYDRANIHSNEGIIRGLCLKCRDDFLVYECTTCERAYNYEYPINRCDCDSD